MDPITTAILAVLAAGATKVGEQVVLDAYGRLKNLLAKKFGAKSKVIKAVKDLEENPRSAARKEVLKEEVAAAKADKDADLLKVAQSLIKIIKAMPEGDHFIQLATGNQNIQIAGDRNTVSVNAPKTKK